MKRSNIIASSFWTTARPRRAERGSALIIAIMLMSILGLFIAASLSQATTEATLMNNDNTNTEAFYAAQASLELMSRDFNQIFDYKITAAQSDLDRVQNDTPPITGFTFGQAVTQVDATSVPTTISQGPFAGLNALRTRYRFDTTATGTNGAQAKLTRTFNNYLVPIFQFGVFYDNDMEFHAGAQFNFGGRVHTNGNLFLMSGPGLYFSNRVTAVKEIVTDVLKNGNTASSVGATMGNVFVSDGSGSFPSVSQGTVTNGPNVNASDATEPTGTLNTGWSAFQTRFNGNLVPYAPKLKLPLTLENNSDPVELIRRGKTTDTALMASSRYYNKESLRITLSDQQSQLPGGSGGVNLTATGADHKLGYWPVQRTGGPARPTRINAARFAPAPGGTPPAMWIKVETVTVNSLNGAVTTNEVTSDFLSLGLTQATTIGATTVGDPDAILKMQRYFITGPPIRVSDLTSTDSTLGASPSSNVNSSGRTAFTYDATGSNNYVTTANYVEASEPAHTDATFGAITAHESIKSVTINGSSVSVLPFPIEMYEPREGLYNEDLTNAGWTSLYGTGGVPVVGVMSMIDIDVANLKRFLNGTFDSQFPGGLTSTSIGNNGGQGWIVYISDRRGDFNNNGAYDDTNVYVADPTSATDDPLQPGENLNGDGVLLKDYTHESAKYTATVASDIGAIWDHSTFRRGVRLINGSSLPGSATRGLTFASENPIYILGNYNATGIATLPTSNTPTSSTQYQGANSPASVVSDAIGILSNQWNDAKSFRFPFNTGSTTDPKARTIQAAAGETTVRAAFLTGHSMSTLLNATNQGGGDKNLAGGVHNFPRLLEYWGGNRLNYCGSLINLFYSRQATGTHKNGSNHVYNAPFRNWIFDATFLDATKLPPGTPYFQYVSMTGFRQTTRQN